MSALACVPSSGNAADSSMALRTICERVFALRYQHRGRIAAHALQRRQQLGDLVVALIERALEDPLLLVELAEARFDGGELGFALLDEVGRFDQPGIEPLALGGKALHVAFQRLGALLHVLQLVALALELLLGVLGLRGRALRQGGGAIRGHSCEHGNAGECAGARANPCQCCHSSPTQRPMSPYGPAAENQRLELRQ